METLSALLAAIPQPDVAGMARAQQHIDGLLKPPGSLGRLETLAVQLAGLPGLQGQLALAEKAIVVMCADHGVWHEGVTPSPQVVTAIHAGNMVRGNTGVCVLAAQAGARVQVVDVGIDADPLPGLINLKVARGSGNIARTAAMSRQQAETVLLASIALMIIGVLITLLPPLVAILAGTVLFTGAFFGAHSVASGWAGTAARAGRAQSSSLYNLGYYGGSSLFGWLGGVFLAEHGWAGTVLMTVGLAVIAGVLALVLLRGAGMEQPSRTPDRSA